MPKPNNLDDLFSLLNQEESPQKNHFLFLLGTDTVFTQRPTISLLDPIQKKSYERGETLSYAAQAVVSILGEEAEVTKTNDPLSYCSPSVDVVNGPTTLGSEVGERIAQGVFLALRAAATGKQNLQISAHSRGAVESILVMHELARIKKALQDEPNKSLFEILSTSPCKYTCTAVQKFFKASEQDNNDARAKLLNRLENLKINPFLIDPVPGGGFLKLPVGWYDDRFSQQPPCNDHELLLYRDERTRCFTPIIPDGMRPIIIPGHHGTGSGNRYNQQLQEVPESIEYRDTTVVQDLVLCKLFHFFQRTTGFLDKQDYQIALEHPQLDQVLNLFLNAQESDRYQLILQLYLKIEKNDDAYRSFSNGSYAYLGAQYAKEKSRFVHFRGHNHQSILDVSPEMNGGFINPEHAMLYLRGYIQFGNLADAKPDELVTTITSALENVVNEMTAVEIGQPSKLLGLLRDKKGREIFFECLSAFVDQISQKYLRNHLLPEENLKLRDVIEKPFNLLKLATSTVGIQQSDLGILKQCENFLQDGLKRTVETHYQSITQQVDELHKQIEFFQASPEHFNAIFQKFVTNLKVDADETGTLSQVKVRLQSLIPVTLEGAKNALIDELEQIRLNEGLTLDQKERINAIIATEQTAHLQDFFEAQQISLEQYLYNIEQLYDLAKSLHKDSPQLELLASKPLNIDRNQLNFRCLDLIWMGGLLLKEGKIDLHVKPESISTNFFELIKKEAIALGAASPEEDDLAKVAESHRKTIDQLKAQEEDLRREIRTISQQREDFSAQVRSLNEEKTAQQKRLESEAELLANLQSPIEMEKAWLITKKLLPLTNKYLKHLLKEAETLQPQLLSHDLNTPLPMPNFISGTGHEPYNMVAQKFNAVLSLKKGLEDKAAVPLPSERLANFRSSLVQVENDLNLHRDPAWKRYLRGCLAIIGIIATGIVPGVVGIAIYSTIADKKMPSFFNQQTKGSEFVEESKELGLSIGG